MYMIEEKVKPSNEVLLHKNLNPENNNYTEDNSIERNTYTKADKFYYKPHLRNIFYRFKGKHIFPDRG